MAKIKQMQPPWNEFSLDHSFYASINNSEEYERIHCVREAIYYRFGEESSLTLGHLPPIISPIFWEVKSGLPNSEIMSVKRPDKAILPETYDRHKMMARYLPNVLKLYIINIHLYRDALEKTYKLNNYEKTQCFSDIQRRLKALDDVRTSILSGEWPNLILAVDEKPRRPGSFTVTPHFHVSLLRGDGPRCHTGFFHYNPRTTPALRNAWVERWNEFLEIARQRRDWDRSINDSQSLESFRGKLDRFNVISTLQIEKSLRGLLWRVRLGPLYQIAETIDRFNVLGFGVNLEKVRNLMKRK